MKLSQWGYVDERSIDPPRLANVPQAQVASASLDGAEPSAAAGEATPAHALMVNSPLGFWSQPPCSLAPRIFFITIHLLLSNAAAELCVPAAAAVVELVLAAP